jgi:hypothetical protein
MLSHEVWNSLALSIKKRVEEYAQDPSNRTAYFDAYRNLQLDPNDTTVDDIVNKLVYWLHLYHLTWIQVVTRVMNLLSFEQLNGADIAMRERLQNKFSAIAAYFTGKMAFPINDTVMKMLMDNTVFLATASVQNGHAIAVPYWLPIQSVDVSTRKAGSDLDNTFFSTLLPRIPFINEIGISSAPGPMYPADTTYENGSLGKYLRAELDASVSIMQSNFDRNTSEARNIIHPNNLLLKMAIEEYGVLSSTMFKFRDFAQQFRKSVRVVDYHEYMSYFPGYLGEHQPVPISNSDQGTVRGVSLMGIPSSEANADYITDLDTYMSGALAGKTVSQRITALLDNPRMPFGAVILSDDQMAVYHRTGKLPVLTTYAGASGTVGGANIDGYEGLISTGSATDEDHWLPHVGFRAKFNSLLELFGSKSIYQDDPQKTISEVLDNTDLIAMSNDALANGVFQPYWMVTPVKDVYDPLFFGLFPLMSVEAASVPGTWTKWLSSKVSNVDTVDVTANGSTSADANESAIGGPDVEYSAGDNLLDPTAEGPFKYAKDVVGPFIGNGVDLDMDEYFMRPALDHYTLYPGVAGTPVNLLPFAPHVRDDVEMSAFDNPERLIGSASTNAAATYEAEGAEYDFDDLNAYNDVQLKTATLAQQVLDRIKYRYVQLIGRTKTTIAHAAYKYIKNVLDVYGGNSFAEYVSKLGPVPTAKAVSVTYSIQQFLDIVKQMSSRNMTSMSVFGEKSFAGSGGRSSGGARRSYNKRADDPRGEFKKKRKRRKRRKKPSYEGKGFDKGVEKDMKEEVAAENTKESSFGDKDGKGDKADFKHPDI